MLFQTKLFLTKIEKYNKNKFYTREGDAGIFEKKFEIILFLCEFDNMNLTI